MARMDPGSASGDQNGLDVGVYVVGMPGLPSLRPSMLTGVGDPAGAQRIDQCSSRRAVLSQPLRTVVVDPQSSRATAPSHYVCIRR